MDHPKIRLELLFNNDLIAKLKLIHLKKKKESDAKFYTAICVVSSTDDTSDGTNILAVHWAFI